MVLKLLGEKQSMIEDVLGPPISFALFLSGCWIGWRLSRLREGEVSVPPKGFARGTSKPVRVFAGAFGAAVAAFLLSLLANRLGSTPLAYVAVAIIAPSIGVGWGAVIRGWLGSLRNAHSDPERRCSTELRLYPNLDGGQVLERPGSA